MSASTHIAQLKAGEEVHVWLKAVDPSSPGRLSLKGAVSNSDVTVPPSDDFRKASFTVTASGPVVFAPAAGTVLSFAYAFDPKTVMAEGMRPLFINEAARIDDGPRYHFAPPFGWMNDPNGFIQLDGETHLFYQHYPHDLQWNSMHWGHAVSHDGGATFTHLPIFLEPRGEFLEKAEERGGAFSGSAIADGAGGIRIVYTDHQDSRTPDIEIQAIAHSADRISVGRSETLIGQRPDTPGFRQDFRDPFVFKGPDNLWKMLVGGRDAKGGVIILYETALADATGGWRFVGILHRSDEPPASPIECPCMASLGDDLFVLIYSNLQSRDPETGRRNLSRSVVGHFDGKVFSPKHHQEFDFGTDAYAFQATMSADGPIGIAWAANWTDVVKGQPFPTAMTLMRRLEWRGDHLATPPIANVSNLRGRLMADAMPLGQSFELLDGTGELQFSLAKPNAPFRLVFEHPTIELALVSDGHSLELVHAPAGAKPGPRYRHATPGLSELRLFIDRGIIEIYANDGRWCCTKRLGDFSPVTALRFDTGDIAAAKLWHIPGNSQSSTQAPRAALTGT